MLTLTFLLSLLYVATILLTTLGTVFTLRDLRIESKIKENHSLPITVLKPLRGIQSGLYENLSSFFRQDYPDYELLFSVANENDPVIPLVRKLIDENKNVSTQLFIGETIVGANPKINNMAKAYQSAKHDWILISDSNVRVAPDYLQKTSAHAKENVGVVTSIVVGTSENSWAGALEAAYLNTFLARWMRLIFKLGRPCVVGKSMFFRKNIAERFGGLKAVSHFLAEDEAFGQAMQHLGYKICLQHEPIQQHIGSHTFKDFWHRHVRWGRIRKYQAPTAFCFELLMSSVVSGLIGAWCSHQFFGVAALHFFAIHLLLWFAGDLLLMGKFNRWTFSMPLVWLVREICTAPLWLHSTLGNTVVWHGQQLRVAPGGILVQTQDTISPKLSRFVTPAVTNCHPLIPSSSFS